MTDSLFSPVPDPSARQARGAGAAVAEGLATAIHEHRLTPGMKLGEDEVGAAFNVSRTVVRAALQTLAHEQLVSIAPHRGAFVAQPDMREAREVFEARALLEPRTAHSAALRATPADIALLEAHISAEHDALAAGETGRALRLSGQFHLDIARIADQATIAAFIANLVSRSSLVIALYWRRRNAICESNAHHALLRALADGNGPEAEALMKSHLVDLLSLLDLSPGARPARTLAEALGKP
ncbi:GntR family transcriptional regulator [Meridianimarinicoccus roseus]|jgi:DNA-binding GntR family transcriptional regulator|uniref:GntR family transcriptional regulator n=1 Tax=Meridianimarinicoccus roseus TaxID=2072018 RepID=A0A2V2LHX0_9RHOB|nr:GntR family transcriptional regulator [Meridianimarinicoccus roseus]PWR03601.1 GntR family transcriptional regulator [Meridianimarinicoccus roseus]